MIPQRGLVFYPLQKLKMQRTPKIHVKFRSTALFKEHSEIKSMPHLKWLKELNILELRSHKQIKEVEAMSV